MKQIFVLLLLVILAASGLSCDMLAGETSPGQARVTNVVDGDTIDINIGGREYRVRYIGIDTPETVNPATGVQPYGKEASVKNKELVDGKLVRLEKDVSETDQYGRLLRYVYAGDLFVNAELVRFGYAQVSTFPPDVKYQSLFLRLQQEARDARRGLWGLMPEGNIPLEIFSVTSPVKAGSNATLTARTAPGADCEIAVYYESGPSSASGLSPRKADDNGEVSWTWRVASNTQRGVWQIEVKATYQGESISRGIVFKVE